MNGQVLVVDDDRDMGALVQADLGRRGFVVQWADSAMRALELIGATEFDVVVTDLRMPETGGLELCQQLLARRPDVPVVVMTAFGSMDTAVAAIRAGAYDFVTKPVEMERLALTVAQAVEHRRLSEQVRMLSRAEGHVPTIQGMVGQSPTMHQLFEQITRIAPSDAAVLISGESGTGKELAARALHQISPRAPRPFVAVNCAAVPETLLESLLYGHKRGAFTDARSDQTGLFVQATGGTLLLDEIGDMPLALQPKLLRALEDRRIRPIGADHEVPVDVRVLASTHHDLEAEVEAGRFRRDLFFRINVIQIELPPLRSRGTDVLLLAQRFLEELAAKTGKKVMGITEPAARKLLDYPWPGNVRELRNVIERAMVLTHFDKLTIDDLPDNVREHQATRLSFGGEDPQELLPLDEVERKYILHVLRIAGDNKAVAARILRLDRKTLYRKLQNYGHGAEHKDGAPPDRSLPPHT